MKMENKIKGIFMFDKNKNEIIKVSGIYIKR